MDVSEKTYFLWQKDILQTVIFIYSETFDKLDKISRSNLLFYSSFDTLYVDTIWAYDSIKDTILHYFSYFFTVDIIQ